MKLSTAETWYYKTAFIPLYQLQLFTDKELKHCHSAPPAPVDNAPRWQRSAKWREAEDLAWQFRQLFYPRTFVRLRPLVTQAFRLFRLGFQAAEIAQAMREAASRGVRSVPKTLLFFVGWIRRLRSWKERMLRDAEAREQCWEDEKRAHAAVVPRLAGMLAHTEGLKPLRWLLDGFAAGVGWQSWGTT